MKPSCGCQELDIRNMFKGKIIEYNGDEGVLRGVRDESMVRDDGGDGVRNISGTIIMDMHINDIHGQHVNSGRVQSR